MAVGSITKTFAAAEVLQLAGLGLVDLDAPVIDYVSVPFGTRAATVRQVLGMRSGFPLDPIEAICESAAGIFDRTFVDGVQDRPAVAPCHHRTAGFRPAAYWAQ